jgi:predicted SnoaL-like aldol condensation-catalyzing enzyme
MSGILATAMPGPPQARHALGACALLLLVACGREPEDPPAAAYPVVEAAVVAQQLAARNKEIAVAFFKMVFDDKKPQEAFDTYSVADYIQHNPLAPDGAAPTIEFLNAWLQRNPNASAEIKKVIAEGNLVAIHHHMRTSPTDPGMACTEWYRVESGRVVEHWDTAQQMPTESQNPHPMF